MKQHYRTPRVRWLRAGLQNRLSFGGLAHITGWRATVLAFRYLVFILALAPAYAPAAAGPGPAGAHTFRLRLELVPFTSPLAQLVVLDETGMSQRTGFYPSGRRVASAGARRLEGGERERIARLLSAAPARRWFASTYAGQGLTQGDQFRLWLASDKPVAEETWGFVDNAPPDLQALIAALIEIAGPAHRYAPTRVSGSYLRARPVDRARLDDLVRTTPVLIAALADFPADMQLKLRDTIADPLVFHPLPSDQRQRFLERRSLGDDVYLRVEGRVFQLQLYSAD
jgi:hypothetical protein